MWSLMNRETSIKKLLRETLVMMGYFIYMTMIICMYLHAGVETRRRGKRGLVGFSWGEAEKKGDPVIIKKASRKRREKGMYEQKAGEREKRSEDNTKRYVDYSKPYKRIRPRKEHK